MASSSSGHSRGPRGWHKRDYLPHYDGGHNIQIITYRLADALPADVVAKLSIEANTNEQTAERRRRIEEYLDAGYGDCLLSRDDVAQIVLDAWLYYDQKRYELLEWVIMPNHVHLLAHFNTSASLSDTIHSWKSYTSHQINRLLNRQGPLWQADYWDRFIRDRDHLADARRYIRENPVKAGLVRAMEDWTWGSAASDRIT